MFNLSHSLFIVTILLQLVLSVTTGVFVRGSMRIKTHTSNKVRSNLSPRKPDADVSTLRNVNLHSQASLKHGLHEDVNEDRVGGDDIFWRWRTGRTARLELRNVHIWQSQVQKRVLNAADS